MVVLFQGDSLTDAGRGRENDDRQYGSGFVHLIAAKLMGENENITVLNRGVGGDRIVDMYARWLEDTLSIDFDILSILCGINDIGFGLRRNTGSDAERFEFIYDRMICEAMAKRPQAKLVLCEPFLFRLEREEALATGNEDIVDNWDIWNKNMLERRAIVKKLAKKHNAVFVPFGEMFDELLKTTKAIRWTFDGIHTKAAATYYMAEKWLECCRELLG